MLRRMMFIPNDSIDGSKTLPKPSTVKKPAAPAASAKISKAKGKKGPTAEEIGTN
jgi:hypothetical protein